MFGCVLALILVAVAAASVTTRGEESSILNQNLRNVISYPWPSALNSLTRERRALKPEPKEKRKNPIVSGFPIFYGNKVFQKPIRNKNEFE